MATQNSKSKRAQKRKGESTPKVFAYKVDIDQICVHEERSEEEYGSWSEDYDNTFNSIKTTTSFPDVVSTVDLTKQEGFLVWLDYSEGDSFGCANRRGIECVAIMPTLALAESLKKTLESWKPGLKNNWGTSDHERFLYKSKDGQVIDYKRAPWAGYFENLDGVHIEPVSLIPIQE